MLKRPPYPFPNHAGFFYKNFSVNGILPSVKGILGKK